MSQLLDKGFTVQVCIEINNVPWLAEPRRVAGEWVWVLREFGPARKWKVVDPENLTVTDEQIPESLGRIKGHYETVVSGSHLDGRA